MFCGESVVWQKCRAAKVFSAKEHAAKVFAAKVPRTVPIHWYQPVSAFFASIGIGKMNHNLADTADTFIL